MRVVGRQIFEDYVAKYADLRQTLDAWLAEAEVAQWKNPVELKQRYPNASLLGDKRVVFNIKGNKYRVVAKIDYESSVVLIERIGTHAEYDKWDL